MSKDTINKDFAFGKENYILVLAGTLITVIGYFLLSGGKSEDPAVMSEAIFNTQRMVVAPVTILIGLAVVGWGIMKKVKD